MKKILIISVGASPAVVTETVWKLFHRDPPFVPQVLHLVTTSAAKGIFQKRGVLGPDGKLAELFESFHHPLAQLEINVPVFSCGKEITDIRTQEENILYGNEIIRLVRDHAADPETQIHMSLAGGRKVMSAYALSAMQLFGRSQDELSHVLVKTPEGVASHMIEFARDFWWPGQKVDPVHYHDQRTGKEVSVPLTGVDVEMSSIPFLRMYATFGKDILKLFPGGRLDLAGVVDAVQEMLEARQILLVRKTRTIIAGRHEIRLEHQDFALYNLLAQAKREGWRGCGPDGMGGNHFGWVSFSELLEDGYILNRFKEIYKELYILEGGDPEEARQRVEEFVRLRILDEMQSEGGNPQEARNTINQMRKGCEQKIKRGLANNMALANRLLIRVGKSGRSFDRIGLLIRAENIQIVDE